MSEVGALLGGQEEVAYEFWEETAAFALDDIVAGDLSEATSEATSEASRMNIDVFELEIG